MLYVTHAYNGNWKDPEALGAYVTAINLRSGDLLWRTAQFVAPGNSFALLDAGLVLGCSFHTKPDFLCVLDRSTGVTRQKLPLRSALENIVRKDDKVFVRTYDTDVVFSVQGAREPAAPRPPP